MPIDVTQTINNSNHARFVYEKKDFLLGGNYDSLPGNVIASGSDVTLSVGLVMGRVAATGAFVALEHDATDGSQYPVGVCFHDQVVDDGTTQEVVLKNSGKIDAGMLTFGGTTTINSLVGPANHQRRLGDILSEMFRLSTGVEITEI